MASIDRIRALSNQLKGNSQFTTSKKKKQDIEEIRNQIKSSSSNKNTTTKKETSLEQSMINITDLANEIKAGNNKSVRNYLSENLTPVSSSRRTSRYIPEEKSWWEQILQVPDAFNDNLRRFDDGYQFGDILGTVGETVGDTVGTVGGTVADVGLGAVKGVVQTGEGLGKLLAGGVAQVADWVGQDDYAEQVRHKLATEEPPMSSAIGNWQKGIDSHSIVGNTGDKVSEAVGYIGSIWAGGALGGAAKGANLAGKGLSAADKAAKVAKATNIAQTGLMFGSSTGNALGEAYGKEGVTDGQAWMKAVGTGAIETATERLFGIFGTSGLDKGIAKAVTSKITSGAGKVFANAGVQASAEAFEEFLSYAGSHFLVDRGIDLISQGKGAKFAEEWNSEELWEQMAVAFLASGALGGGASVSSTISNKTNTNTWGDAINETAKQQDIQALQEDIENLNKKLRKEGTHSTKGEAIQAQINEKQAQIQALQAPVDNTAQIQGLQEAITAKQQELAQSQDPREQQIIQEEITNLQQELTEATNAQQFTDGRKQRFTYEAQETDSEYKQAVYESASKIFDNTKESHDFVDVVAKIAEDRGTVYEFTNIEGLKQAGYNIENASVNGLVTEDGKVLINVDSKSRGLDFILGHETTHLLEGTQEYQALQDLVLNYAKEKGIYEDRVAKLHSLYKDTNANIDNEITSDLVGELLFTDTKFIENLSVKEPTLFEKIKNFISDLIVKFKGTAQEKQLREIQRSFEKAYRAKGTQTTANTKYSLSEDTELSDEAKKQLHRYTNMDTNQLNQAFSEAVDNKENMLMEYNNLQKEYKEFQNTEEFKNALNDFVHSETPTQETTDLMNKANKYAEKLRYYNTQYEKYKAQQDAINSLLMGNETDTRSVEQIVKEAEKHFGITNDFNETAYIDINGKQLDFSGKKDGGQQGRRSLDHRQINEINTDMDSFIQMGNVRLKPEGNGFEVYKMPNDKQLSKLQSYVEQLEGDFYVDVVNSRGTYDYGTYKSGTPFSKVVSDLKVYFETGSFPAESDISKFRYSLSAEDEAPIGNVFGSDLKYQVEEAIAPLQETIEALTEQVQTLQDNIIPIAEQNIEIAPVQEITPTQPTLEEVQNLIDIRDNKSGSEYASAFFALRDKYGQRELYKSLNEYYSTGTVTQPSIDTTPTSQEVVEQQNQEAFTNITDNDVPTIDTDNMSFEDVVDSVMMNETYESDNATEIKPESPLENRDIDEVGNRKIKAYQYENPEVRPYFQVEAENMLYDLDNTIKGEKIAIKDQEGYITDWAGITRQTTEAIAYLKDKYGYSYAQIEKGLKDIIEDNGKENNAVAKRIEFMLDERLREGYTTSDGIPIPPNEDYINFLSERQITQYNQEAFNALTDADVPQIETEVPQIQEDIIPTQQNEAIEPRETAITAQNVQSQQTIPMKQETAQNPNPDAPDGKMRKWVKTSTESDVVNREILPDDLDQTQIMYQPITNRGTLDKANTKLDTLGYEQAVQYFNNQIVNKKTSVEDIALGERLIQEAIRNKDTKTAGELIQNVAILGTELGQKVQALSIIQRMTPEGQLKMLEKTINRGKAKDDKAFTDTKLTQDMKDKILNTYNEDGSYNQDELNKAVEEVKQEIANNMRVTKMDKINAWRYLSMLGNPKTHIRNLVSNVAMKGTTKVKNAIARTIETIAPIETKTKTWKATSDEVKNFAKQTTIEMKDIISGDDKYSEEADIKSKREIFKNKVINKLYNFNSDLLEKEDWWFSKGAFESSLSEFLTANGIRTQQDIENNKELIEKGKIYALEQSQIATFRQYSWLSNKIRDIENKNAATQVAVGSILPFKKTPINIAKAGLNYSPLGFAKTLTYDIAQVKKGNMEASKLVDHLAQNITGTGLALVGYILAQAGLLNGGGDDDKEGKYDYYLGKQAYSLNIGGNTYSLSWLSPVAMPLFVGVNAFEQLVEGEEWNPDIVLETLGQTLDPLSEMSFLSSLDSVLSSYDTGTQRFFGIGEAMLQNYATQFVPTVSSQLASTLDDTKRSTKVSGDSGNKIVEETYNKLIYKIPFLRETLEPSTDIWGNEVKQNENLFARAFENFISPYSRKESIATEIDEELKDLFAQTGDNGLIPNVPYNYINYGGEKYKMSAEEYTDFKKTYGQTANDLLEDLFKTNTYKNSTAEDKAEMVNDVYDYANDLAKKDYLSKEGVEYTNATKDDEKYYKENSIKEAIKHDMTVEQYELYTDDPEEYSFLNGKDNAYKTKYFSTQESISDIEKGFDKQKDDISVENMSNEEYEEAVDTLSSEKKKAIVDKIINSGLEDTEKASLYKKYYNSDTVDTVVKSGINVDDYLTYSTMEFKADYNSKGKPISNSRKNKVISYVNDLNMSIPQKAILIKSTNTFKFNEYNNEIVSYIVDLDIDYDEKVSILKDLDMEVSSDGTVSW